jgi:hypothetical protein
MNKNMSSIVKSLNNEPTTRYKTKNGFKTFEEIVEDAVKKHSNQENESKFIYKTDSKTEFLYAVHGVDFLLALWRIDNELWKTIKWGDPAKYSEEKKKAYQEVRELITQKMDELNLSLDMLE